MCRPEVRAVGQVTPECKDLLVRLLVADPERRMSMDEIKAHTWFSHALPTGALHMNDWYMSHPSGIDEVTSHLCRRRSPGLLEKGKAHTLVLPTINQWASSRHSVLYFASSLLDHTAFTRRSAQDTFAICSPPYHNTSSASWRLLHPACQLPPRPAVDPGNKCDDS